MTLDFCEVTGHGGTEFSATSTGAPDKASSLFDTDEFRMFCFKAYRHDWTTCHFAHVAERARRRDPRKSKYTDVVCPEMKKNKVCSRGDDCPCAHNLFEFWLHPNRYRTQLCKDGKLCNRKLCFFAHSAAELRQPGGGDACLAQLALHAKLAYSPDPTLQFSDESPIMSGSFAGEEGFPSSDGNVVKGQALHAALSSPIPTWRGPSRSSSGRSQTSPEDSHDDNTTRAAADLLAKVVCTLGANKLGTERDIADELHKVLQSDRGVTLLQGLVSELETRQSSGSGQAPASSSATPREQINFSSSMPGHSVAYAPMIYGPRERVNTSNVRHNRSASTGAAEQLCAQLSGMNLNPAKVLRQSHSMKEPAGLTVTSAPSIPLSSGSSASPRSPPGSDAARGMPALGIPCSQPSASHMGSWNMPSSWDIASAQSSAPDNTATQGSTAAYLLAAAAASEKAAQSHSALGGLSPELLEQLYAVQSRAGSQPMLDLSPLQARGSEQMMPTPAAGMGGQNTTRDMEALLQFFAMQHY